MQLQFNKSTKPQPCSIIDKFAIGVDTFTFQLKAPDRDKENNKQHLLNIHITDCQESYQANGFTLKKEVSNHPAYHIQFGIYHAKQRLGTLYSHPTKGSGYSKHLRPLHVENRALYAMDFARLIPELLQAFDFTLNNITRLDIFADNQQRDPAELIQMLIQDSTNYQRVKHRNDSGLQAHGTISEIDGSIDYTTYIGNDSRRVRSKIYNKTAENNKAEINDWHKANGLAADSPVYRFEVSAKSEAFATYKSCAVTEDGELVSLHRFNNHITIKASKAVKITDKTKLEIDINRLNDKAYLVSLFAHFINIDIRRKDATRLTNCSKVPLFDFSIYGKGELNTTVTQSINMKEDMKHKKYIQESLEDFKATGNIDYLKVANAKAERYDLSTELALLIEAMHLKESIKSFGLDFLLDNYQTLQKHNLSAALITISP